MKRRDALSVGQIIDQAIAATGNSDTFLRQQVCFLWQEVVGATINHYTTRRWVDRDVLHVCITSGPLKNELTYSASAIVDKLNEAVGQHVISSIIFH